jgi:maltodextrin utilization protein YvdJ
MVGTGVVVEVEVLQGIQREINNINKEGKSSDPVVEKIFRDLKSSKLSNLKLLDTLETIRTTSNTMSISDMKYIISLLTKSEKYLKFKPTEKYIEELRRAILKRESNQLKREG